MFDLAIYYRMVGGFVGTGSSFLARARWSVTMAFYMAFATLTHAESLIRILSVFILTMFATFAGRLIPHDYFQDKASFLNSLAMSAINVVRLLLILLPYSFLDFVDYSPYMVFDHDRLSLTAIGVLSGLAYFVGNSYLTGKDSGIYFRNTPKQFQTGITNMTSAPLQETLLDHAAWGGSEWGELLTGLLCYELMFLSSLVMP